MTKPDASGKRLAISKANAQMVGIVAAASFISVFCLIAGQTVWGQVRYQSKVISAKQQAHNQLQKNLQNFDELVASYKAFDNAPSNAIGGAKDGNGDNDGSNSKIILDALPSTYDFPALASSLEKILHDQGVQGSISGTDDQLAQQGNTTSTSPTAVPMPFTVTINKVNYNGVQDFIKKLQSSIRPIQVDSIDVNGGGSDMTVTLQAHTYYQPGKSVNIDKKVVK